MLKQIRTIKWLFLLKGKNYIKSLNRQFPHIEPSSKLNSCHFYLNKTTELTIDSECYLRNVKIFAFSGANKIYIGKNTKNIRLYNNSQQWKYYNREKQYYTKT